jgi:hypothetical protein
MDYKINGLEVLKKSFGLKTKKKKFDFRNISEIPYNTFWKLSEVL